MKVIDKIRAMSTEKVAEYLNRQADLPKGFEKFCETRSTFDEDGELVCTREFNCKTCIRDWLESEVEEQ